MATGAAPHLAVAVTLTPESHDAVPLTNAHEPELRPTDASVLHQPHCMLEGRPPHAVHVAAPFLHAWLSSYTVASVKNKKFFL
jgi:hypothetical protein